MYAEGVKEPEHVELLSEELAAIKKTDNGDGPLKLLPKMGVAGKPGVKQILGRSPDFSDLFLMKKLYDLMRSMKPKNSYSSLSS